MFSSITWEDFLITLFLITGGYYAVTALLLYHKEIRHWFISRQDKSKPSFDASENEETVSADMMGTIGPEEDPLDQRSALISTEEVQITEADTTMPDTIRSAGGDDLLTGSVADLMQEIKTLLQLVTEYNSSREECASLFTALFQRFPHVRDTTYQQAINRHICEESKSRFSFDLLPLEVRSWWESSDKR